MLTPHLELLLITPCLDFSAVGTGLVRDAGGEGRGNLQEDGHQLRYTAT